MLSSYCGQIPSCLPVCSALRVHPRFANTKGLNALQAKSQLTSTGTREIFTKRPYKTKKKVFLVLVYVLEIYPVIPQSQPANHRSKSCLVSPNSSSPQRFNCRAKYQTAPLLIRLNLDFDRQDALVLQPQASFKEICSSEQSDMVH